MDFTNDSRDQYFYSTIYLLFNAIKPILTKIYFSKIFQLSERKCIDSSPAPRPLRNIGLNCYLNSAFQSIVACPRFVYEMKKLEDLYPTAKNLFAFNNILAALSDNSHESMSLPSNEILRNWNKDGEQDTFELLSHMICQVFNEFQKMEPKKTTDFSDTEKLLPLHISMVFKLKCSSDHNSTQTIQSDLAIHLPIPFRLTTEELLIEKLMDNYFLEENITDSKCTHFLCDGHLSKFVTLKKPLPSTLCIHLQRSFWNSSFGCMQKNNEKVRFYEKLIIKGKYFSLTRNTKCMEGIFFQTFNGLFNKTMAPVNKKDSLLKYIVYDDNNTDQVKDKDIVLDDMQSCFTNFLAHNLEDQQNIVSPSNWLANDQSQESDVKENGFDDSVYPHLPETSTQEILVDINKNNEELNETKQYDEDKCECNVSVNKTENDVIQNLDGDGTAEIVGYANETEQLTDEIREEYEENTDRVYKDNDEEYILKSVIVHFGNAESGHYICHRKCGNKWFCTNDSFIREVSLHEVLNSEAYILMYEKL